MIPIAVLGYTDIYKKPLPVDHFALLRKYSTDLIILYLSKINVYLFQETDGKEQALKIFENVFVKQNSTPLDYKYLISRIIKNKHHVLFSAISISYLIKRSLSEFRKSNESDEIDIPTFQKELFDTILIFNTLIYREDIGENYHGLWAIAIRQQAYLRDFNALSYTAPMKFMMLERFFNQSNENKLVLEDFQQQLQLGNFWSFAKTFLDLIQLVISKEGAGQNILNKDDLHPKVIELFSYKKSQPIEEVSIHLNVIPRPFYQVEDEHFAILDFSYFRYMFDQGIMWFIYNNSYLRNSERFKDFGAYRSYLGLEYFEKFLVKKLLQSIFRKRHHAVISNELYQDFWVRANLKELFIIECKMVDLHPLTSESFDVKKFESFLNDQFAKPKQNKGKAKGVYQLSTQLDILETLSDETKKKLNIKSLKNLKVYPVIIYSDQILDSAGVNSFLNDKLANVRNDQFPYSFNMRPLTLVNINTLLEYFGDFHDNPNQLGLKVTEYHKYLVGKRRDYHKFGGLHLYHQHNISFSEFLNLKSTGSKSRMLHNLELIKRLINDGQFG